jgi:hypothetical protein
MTDFTETRSMPTATTVLKKLRSKHGYNSQIGRRCSNIMELMDQCPRPPSEWIDYLMPDHVPAHYEATRQRIELQTTDLHKLLAA